MSSVIEISPLTRVEGHGRIVVCLDGNRVERVELSLFEAPRLFEALLLGKGYREVPEIICRICAICSTVHRLVSLRAIEKALGIEVSDQVRLYRELILLAGQIQSHALHLYCLVLPDHFGVAGVAGLAAAAPDELKMGLHIKETANFIQETVGGRLLHPVTLIPGGMGKPVTQAILREISDRLASTIPEAWQTYRMFATFPMETGGLSRHDFMATEVVSVPQSCERLLTGEHGSFPVERYREMLSEQVVSHSNAKWSTIGNEPVVVGALARLRLGIGPSPTTPPLLCQARERFEYHDIRANNLAQAVELVIAVERAMELVGTLLRNDYRKESPPPDARRAGSGTAAIEAPRGTLIHSYAFDNEGVCTAADIVTPTAINQAAMEHDLLMLAKSMGGADENEMTFAMERLVRAYDPCISCAVHLQRLTSNNSGV